MKNLWQQMREYVPMAAVLLLCMIIVPTAQASTNNNGGASTTSTAATVSEQTNSQSAVTAVAGDTNPAKAKQKVITKPPEKSMLDTEVLASPMAYFKNAFSSEEDSADSASNTNVVMLAVKALIATLLSTIM
ncbi:hypothetical protein DXT99_21430 [Pontibacter diazotrophicus]|uniref:Uncharacterized protein n=1 Tax=Pontibacter diazotrophicus TaxID=1400979 RepID=A0A3D8L6W8_9BACT|nr:hypothetical protein [Pontibacter diazotrophicus]RDV13063.1 hypothetical protein DXT99_21430 [Pontibacter diazotrophicus]